MSIPQAAKENDRTISEALKSKAETDSVLAGALFDSYKNGHFKAWGYRSLQEYLRERFSGEEYDRLARMHARSVSRLIREYRLAMEIPAFKEAFDLIPRSKRRLLAQVITPENAGEWIQKAEKLTYRQLESLVITVEEAKRPEDKPSVKRLILQPDLRKLYDEAMQVASLLIKSDSGDPVVAECARLEMILSEFIGTYGAADGFKLFTVSECPACGAPSAMKRQPEQDQPNGDGKILSFRCSQCGAQLGMRVV